MRGRCSWCGARKAFVVPIEELGPIFREVVAIYHQDPDVRGEPISWLLQEDWNIFSERIVGEEQEIIGNHLLQDMVVAILMSGLHHKDILEMGIDYGGGFVRSERFHSTLEENWEDEVAKLLSEPETFLRVGEDCPTSISTHERPEPEATTSPLEGAEAYFNISPLPAISEIDRIEFALSDVGQTYPAATILYRARIHKDRTREIRFTLDELGAPPPDKTPPQRANRAGEPVLYMASDMQTALAEVRAWKGAVVAVAKMKILTELSILDLSEPYSVDSPFFDESLGWRIEAYELLDRFGLELSRPVMPHEKETLYVPTQHLCDLARNAGFMGIAYPSAMGPGHNVVLFDPGAAITTEITYKRVGGIGFNIQDMTDMERVFDDVPW